MNEPGACTDNTYYINNKKKCDNASQNSALWKGKSTTVTVTHIFNGSEGMTAVTEPTVTNGRLNPKGKITGYNWSSMKSLVPAELIPELPADASLLSAEIANVSYTTYLLEAGDAAVGSLSTSGTPILDTIVTGILF